MRKPVFSMILMIVVGCALLQIGCVHSKLGPGPLDEDLVNDGSPEAQADLLRQYRLAYQNGDITRPGVDAEELGVDEVRAHAASDEAHNYLESSDPAAQDLETLPVAFARFTSSGTIYYAVALCFALGGAGLAFAANVDPLVGGSYTNEYLATLGWSVVAGAFTGVVLSWPVLALTSWLVLPLSAWLAGPDYKKAVRTYNKDLKRRIKGAVRKMPEPAAVPIAPSVAPAAGMVESMDVDPQTDSVTQADPGPEPDPGPESDPGNLHKPASDSVSQP